MEDKGGIVTPEVRKIFMIQKKKKKNASTRSKNIDCINKFI